MTSHLTFLTGASRGMGRAMAAQLLAAGDTLICISRQTDDALAAEAEAAGATLEQWSLDLAAPQVAAERVGSWLAARDANAFASVTLINNAGTIGRIGPLAEADLTDVAQSLRIGLEAPMLLTAAFLRATAGWRGVRKVLNISSGLGRNAMASQSPYCAAKAGIDHFSRAVALEEALQPNGAKIVSLAPGVIDTDMQGVIRGTDAALFPDRARFEKLKSDGLLDSPATAAAKVLAYLARADFGSKPVADVRTD
ncbi:SDR family NAD(P)-dependent oxidoreductase [Variovorax sp. RHLX14]|uniref:SDR family NAD(P)-dependent oxidoreductase n=1 Tax=Variovorax sp. RHLX14 TaxID=1259731 RepID=UPI003F466C87